MLLYDIFLQMLLMLPLILGIYISYRVLRITDLGVETSFVFSACVFTKIISLYDGYMLAIVCGVLSCVIIGLSLSFAHRKFLMSPLISGILMIFMMQSVYFFVLGKPNLPILKEPNESIEFVIYLILNLTIFTLFILFMRSIYGLRLRAVGESSKLAKRVNIKTEIYYSLALVSSHILSGLSGMMHVIYGGFADVYMGVGMSLVGISSLMIGISILKPHNNETYNLKYEIKRILLGILVYSATLSILLQVGVDPVYLKIILGGVIFVSIYLSQNNKKEEGHVVY